MIVIAYSDDDRHHHARERPQVHHQAGRFPHLALGGDQGGSIRIPSSFCGIYGMKPTHGLVPYTGIMPIEICVDHTGPMTRSVADNALLLEVLAGPDGYDPRQYNVKMHPYTSMLEGGVKGMRIGIVTEGFEPPNAEAEVNTKVREAAAHLAAALVPRSRRSRSRCIWLVSPYGCRSAWRG